jgi:hypothetical protein
MSANHTMSTSSYTKQQLARTHLAPWQPIYEECYHLTTGFLKRSILAASLGVRVTPREATRTSPDPPRLNSLLLLSPRRRRAKHGVVGGGRPSSLARGGLRLLLHVPLDDVLPAAEKGAGAAAPGFYGDGCTGSAAAGTWGAAASPLVVLVVERRSSCSGFGRRPAWWACGSARAAVDPVFMPSDLASWTAFFTSSGRDPAGQESEIPEGWRGFLPHGYSLWLPGCCFGRVPLGVLWGIRAAG